LKQNCNILKCNQNSITLWGHSAGAGDINILALSSLSNHLFQRAIIQSGSAFAYYSYDKFHLDRYKSYRSYFNCTHLPESITNENSAMTLLIKNCLLNVTLEKLFDFRYALIDSPGPINDAFLGPEKSLINTSPRKMLKENIENFQKIDILTGINRVEGFSFEGKNFK
jgi:carboxylesterase type B